MKKFIGRMIFIVIKAGGKYLGKCLLAFLIEKIGKRKPENIFEILEQLALAAVLTYIAKISKKENA